MDGPKVVFTIPIFGGIEITETIVIGWFVILIVLIASLYLTSGLKKIPNTKRQVIAEMLVGFVNNTVKKTMGERFIYFAPYIAALLLYSLLGSLVSLIGLRSVTADLNTTIAMALVTFVLITFFKIKTNGFFGYIKGFGSPIVLLAPLNVISEIATPLSMSFRMFGNIAGGSIITMLLYMALGAASKALHLSFQLGALQLNVVQVFIPAVLSIYFDLFTGCIQAYIFAMLTMVNVSMAADKS